jgi:predicted alpha/beta superfamily hydrolase
MYRKASDCLWFRTLVGLVGAVVSFPGPLASQTPQWQPWSWTTDSIQSAALGAMRHVRIALPFEYAREGYEQERYAVLVVVGAEDGVAFGALLSNVRLLEGGLGGAVPPLIIVGVMPGGGPASDWYPLGSTALSFRNQDSQAQAVGQFLATELLPWVRQRFRTLPYTIIAGHSSPGHFAVYAFAHFPDAFQAAVAISPAYWWISRDANDDALSRADAELIAKRKEPGRLFIAVGAYDPVPIRDGVEHLTRHLMARGLTTKVQHQILAADNHGTSRQSGYVDGLRWVFHPISLSANQIYANMKPFGAIDTALLTRAYADTKRRYASGAREFGIPAALPESYVTAMARLLSANRQSQLMPLVRHMCEDAVTWYSTRPSAHVCLAEVLLNSDSLKARQHYGEALTLARRANMSNTVRVLERQLARLDSALKR